MSTVHDEPAPPPRASLDEEPRAAPDPADPDDGIHIAFVTRVDRPFGPLLLVVVSWFELGHWVERTYELTDDPRLL